VKVLNLRCAQGHGFEGWYASEEDFQSQQDRRAIECPLCGHAEITRLPTAPRLNLTHGRDAAPFASTPRPADGAAAGPPMPAPDLQAQALWLSAARELLQKTEDVGPRFPEEARRMHYGEIDPRAIRGEASPEERDALREEGIEVVSLPLPPGLKGPVQ
jgi:hypothetical protein